MRAVPAASVGDHDERGGRVGAGASEVGAVGLVGHDAAVSRDRRCGRCARTELTRRRGRHELRSSRIRWWPQSTRTRWRVPARYGPVPGPATNTTRVPSDVRVDRRPGDERLLRCHGNRARRVDRVGQRIAASRIDVAEHRRSGRPGDHRPSNDSAGVGSGADGARTGDRVDGDRRRERARWDRRAAVDRHELHRCSGSGGNRVGDDAAIAAHAGMRARRVGHWRRGACRPIADHHLRAAEGSPVSSSRTPRRCRRRRCEGTCSASTPRHRSGVATRPRRASTRRVRRDRGRSWPRTCP